DMRMGGGELTAWTVVNRYPEEELANILKNYGEERQARRIARAIVGDRRQRPFETTAELSSLIERLSPSRPAAGRPRLHPATRTFQALRIETNDELDQVRQLLDQSVRMLEQDARMVIISYHSLEDRIVKHTLRDLATGEIEPITGRPRAESQVIEVLTKKPVRPSAQEVAVNRRARSARLRAARRL
ncbi:MAG: 16S rRNA (cytosine(1402)-N(4))-methyltransferase RsmH, partial [Bosea sp.]|uniref:16S rRNA (cytosine(1402)-N(4))-methyltransferase RsmH n=1 Tax=Bosea sp. (in: a-proteobacteria) TaxID=1871050 RepID=UPI002384F63E|nr:16S rRNA (cytosine(1402)-N(4))-methyltransferase RsmH [Bosea sp. (in: a-proteobacteria)]